MELEYDSPSDEELMNTVRRRVNVLLDERTTFADQIEVTAIAGQVVVNVSDAPMNDYVLSGEIREMLDAEFRGYFDVRFDGTNDARVRVDIL